MMRVGAALTLACLLAFRGTTLRAAEDTLPPLVDGRAPTTLKELWGDYDPRKEPLETQVVREWTEKAGTYRIVIFTVGTFKGTPARMAAFYGFPTGEKNLPAILDIHGGGGSANMTVVRHAVENGYAGLSINWNGARIEKMEAGDPNTDWGAVDGTQKHVESHTDPKAIDAIESPRNSIWFLLFIAARRGLTFLEQQPEVDSSRLGLTGHSMGGKVTTCVAGIDKRVRAAVPSCGGAGSVTGKLSGMPGAVSAAAKPVTLATIDDIAYLPHITCPILFSSASNDFAGPFDNMTINWREIPSKDVVTVISPHLNHRSIPEAGICSILWLDHHLKGTFSFPKPPELIVSLTTPSGRPRATVKPERLHEVTGVDIYYSVDPHCLTRFWRDAHARKMGDEWVADCPIMSTSQPLFVYANVAYKLEHPCVGMFGSKPPASFIVSSSEAIYLPTDLTDAGVTPTDTWSRVIDDCSREWHDWYRLEWGNPHVWNATTRKLKDPKWRGPEGARLVFDVKCPDDNVLAVVVDLNGWGVYPGKPSGSYEARKPLKGSPDWQTVSVSLDDMRSTKQDDAGPMTSWDTVTELSFRRAKAYLDNGVDVPFGTDAQGWRAPREFRNLRWEGGADVKEGAVSGVGTDAVPKDLDDTIKAAIKKSFE
jgi:Acetyl xylan esterase (AXE1)